jgi:hypothetical protein
MSSHYFDTTNHKKSQCDFTFKADQVPKLWATTWSSQGLCQLLTSNQLLTKSPSWVWIESQFHKTDQVSKLWATIWSSLDLYQLLTSNQLLIKSNPNEHQYKSNWCLIGEEFLQEKFIWQRHWATTKKLGFYQEGNRVFLTNKFLIQGGRGQNRIKNYRGDHHEFRDFWWKFHDFWTNGAIRKK